MSKRRRKKCCKEKSEEIQSREPASPSYSRRKVPSLFMDCNFEHEMCLFHYWPMANKYIIFKRTTIANLHMHICRCMPRPMWAFIIAPRCTIRWCVSSENYSKLVLFCGIAVIRRYHNQNAIWEIITFPSNKIKGLHIWMCLVTSWACALTLKFVSDVLIDSTASISCPRSSMKCDKIRCGKLGIVYFYIKFVWRLPPSVPVFSTPWMSFQYKQYEDETSSY